MEGKIVIEKRQNRSKILDATLMIKMGKKTIFQQSTSGKGRRIFSQGMAKNQWHYSHYDDGGAALKMEKQHFFSDFQAVLFLSRQVLSTYCKRHHSSHHQDDILHMMSKNLQWIYRVTKEIFISTSSQRRRELHQEKSFRRHGSLLFVLFTTLMLQKQQYYYSGSSIIGIMAFKNIK